MPIELECLSEGHQDTDICRQFIRSSAFFSDLGDDEVNDLARWTEAYAAPLGSTIFREGEEEARLIYIVEGVIDIFKEIGDREYMKIASVKAGATIGEMGIVDGQPLSASAIPSQPAKILVISRHNFDELVRNNGTLGAKLLWKIARIISIRLRQTTGLLADISVTQ